MTLKASLIFLLSSDSILKLFDLLDLVLNFLSGKSQVLSQPSDHILRFLLPFLFFVLVEVSYQFCLVCLAVAQPGGKLNDIVLKIFDDALLLKVLDLPFLK